VTAQLAPESAWALAAQRLEGWRPDDEQIAVLDELAHGTLTVPQFLGWCRRRYREEQPPRRTVFARRRPYLVPGTSVLVNNLGLTEAPLLAAAEHAISAGRTVGLLKNPPSSLSVCDAHRAIFADIYPWAGEPRITRVTKGDVEFATVPQLSTGLARTARDVDEAFACADGYGPTALAYRLARIYADYNAVHPFREGNGRAGTLILQLIAQRGGRWLALDRVTRTDWIAASRASMVGATLAGPDPTPFADLLAPLVTTREAAANG